VYEIYHYQCAVSLYYVTFMKFSYISQLVTIDTEAANDPSMAYTGYTAIL